MPCFSNIYIFFISQIEFSISREMNWIITFAEVSKIFFLNSFEWKDSFYSNFSIFLSGFRIAVNPENRQRFPDCGVI